MRNQKKTEGSSSKLYEQSFVAFCSQFVQPKIIQEDGIFHIKKVREEFVKTVAEVENTDASNYKTTHLKHRMKKCFPQLIFQSSKWKNKSEIVYSSDIKSAGIVESAAYVDSSKTSYTDTDDDDNDDDESEAGETGNSKLKNTCMLDTTLKDFYNVALALRAKMDEKTNEQ